MSSLRILSVVGLVVTVINTVYCSPTWNPPNKGAPPTFLKPFILPASFARSTLSQDLLNILKQSQCSLLPPSQSNACTSPPSDPLPEADNPTPVSAPSNPTPAVSAPSNPLIPILEKLLASYDLASSKKSSSCASPPASTIESKNELLADSDSVSSNSPVSDQTSCDSQLDRPPNFNIFAPPSVPSPEPVQNSNPNPTPELASLTLQSAETQLPEQTPPAIPSPTASCPPPLTATPPCPGSKLLSIKPLNLPSKFNQELIRLLSEAQATLSQEPIQNASPNFTPPPCSTPPSEAPPLLPDNSPSLPFDSKVSCPSTDSPPLTAASSQRACQLLNQLLSSPSTIRQLKSILGYSAPSSNSMPEPTESRKQPSTPNGCINPSFVKYLSTIPGLSLNRQ